MKKRVVTVFGTRPEAIKMAPLVKALESEESIESIVVVTAQHRQMLDQVLELFEIKPDFDLDIMKANQDLFDVTSRVLLGMREVLREIKPDIVCVHGDTTTCFAAALAAFYEGIPIAHVEAGLRTGDLSAPFPEEANRSLVGRIATYHFAPTETAKQNLLTENVKDSHIWVTGNTVIDALLSVKEKLPNIQTEYWNTALGKETVDKILNKEGPFVLITGHRRENFGQGFLNLCEAISELANEHPNWLFVYPVHLNPNVQKPVYELLSNLSNVLLIEPVDYLPFVWLMDKSDIVLTDSGGIQEEAPSLGKPVLVTRDVTERPESVDAGTVQLVGTDKAKIKQNLNNILLNKDIYQTMSKAHNPYGDGKACKRIINSLINCNYSI